MKSSPRDKDVLKSQPLAQLRAAAAGARSIRSGQRSLSFITHATNRHEDGGNPRRPIAIIVKQFDANRRHATDTTPYIFGELRTRMNITTKLSSAPGSVTTQEHVRASFLARAGRTKLDGKKKLQASPRLPVRLDGLLPSFLSAAAAARPEPRLPEESHCSMHTLRCRAA
jgi:hypothetical protein